MQSSPLEHITVGDYMISVFKKAIKTIRLSVYPEGRVRLAVPLHTKVETVRALLSSKIPWIKKQFIKFQSQFEQTLQQPQFRVYRKPKLISGETHYFRGKAYILNLIQHKKAACLVCNDKSTEGADLPARLDFYLREGKGNLVRTRRSAFAKCCRKDLEARLLPLLEKWQVIIGVQTTKWCIRQMRRRWGSCNITRKRVVFNLELAKKADFCLEYVVVHELTHLLGRNHSRRFWGLVDKFLPEWRFARDELNGKKR